MSLDVAELQTLGQNALVDKMTAIRDELEKLHAFKSPTRAQEARMAELLDDAEVIDGRIYELQRESAYERVRQAAAAGHVESGDGACRPGDRPGGRPLRSGGGARDRAMRHLDGYVRSGDLDAAGAERVEQLMRASDFAPLAQRWAAAGSDPDYLQAFLKAISGERGHLLWTPAEQAAYRRVEEVRTEMRAMSAGTLATGGYQIPTVIDPSIRISSDGSISPIRQLAEVRMEIGQSFRPVTSAHVQNTWTAEHAPFTDGTPTLASPEITGKKATSFVPFSFEYESAAFGGALGELTNLLVDGLDQLTASAFLDGNGTTQPEGLWTGLEGTSSELPSTVSETFSSADVYETQNQLPARFQPNATWQANLATINQLDQAETSNGGKLFPHVGDAEPVLLRKRLYENSVMRGVGDIATNTTADNPVVIYGDIAQAYTIVNFAGTSVELVPHLFQQETNGTGVGMPTGERGLLLWARVGAGVVIPNAARVLNVATTA